MRTLALAPVAVALGLLGSGGAGAGTLTSASLTLVVTTLPPVTFVAVGLTGLGSASGTGLGAAWSVAAGAVPGGTVTTTVPTTVGILTQLQGVVNGNPAAGAFAGSSGGDMAVTGVVNVKGFGGLTLLKIPLAIGSPGTAITGGGGITVTAFANAWTTKTAALFTTASSGVVTMMGANGLVGGNGPVVLVTALNVFSSTSGQIPSFALLSLNYAPAPEPGLLAAAGTGTAILLALGIRKRVR